MQISPSQLQQVGAAQVRTHAAQWRDRVDAALPPERVADPAARLAALADQVASDVEQLGIAGPLLAVDVHQTAAWLRMALQAGAPYRESRALALLHTAAALGALWFRDDRLLAPADMLPLRDTIEHTIGGLLESPQGARFRQAAQAGEHLRDGLRFALRHTLADGLSAGSERALMAAAFVGHAPQDEEETDRARDERTPSEQSAASFVGHERSLLSQAGIVERELQALCVVGDLAFGMGRCVRLLARAGHTLDAGARAAWLARAIAALGEFDG
jgi:hypothetical protein